MPDIPGVGEWLRGSGSDADIVISSRIRLARNVVGFPLKARLSEEDAAILCDHLRRRIQAAELSFRKRSTSHCTRLRAAAACTASRTSAACSSRCTALFRAGTPQ